MVSINTVYHQISLPCTNYNTLSPLTYQNLCDYLWHRDGSSFGRLLPKKRLWYSLKESGQLLFYKNKESFTKNVY